LESALITIEQFFINAIEPEVVHNLQEMDNKYTDYYKEQQNL
jgi:hypothetical protein